MEPGAQPVPLEDTWDRVARAIAQAEAPHERATWATRFRAVLDGFRFLPGGRLMARAGIDRRATLLGGFAMGPIGDTIDGIFDALKEGAVTIEQGGGVGYDVSTLRASGADARAAGALAAGPVAFLRVLDAMCDALSSDGAPRGAITASVRCDHPDIEELVAAKSALGLRNVRVSVLVTDALLDAARTDGEWPLVSPERVVHRTVRARDLWDAIARGAFERGDPSVLFVDRVNRCNNLGYREQISTTDPFGGGPLPAYGARDLGAIDLPAFVRRPHRTGARLDGDAIERTVEIAVRMLDDVIDVTPFPLPRQRDEARATRRIGLGITGLADALAMLGVHYASECGRRVAADTMRAISHAAYCASIELAREKGPFPALERAKYLDAPFVAALPTHVRDGIARVGIRNGDLIAVVPAASSGLEPLARVAPEEQLGMHAALQAFVDGAVASTIEIPRGYPFASFERLLDVAYKSGLKGFAASPLRDGA